MNTSQFNDNNFKQEVLESKQPVLVDFWAEWCGPCKMIAPVIEELAAEYKNKMKIGKFEIDDNPKIPGQYGIMSIPTIMFFKSGKVMWQLVGVQNKAELKKRIEEIIR